MTNLKKILGGFLVPLAFVVGLLAGAPFSAVVPASTSTAQADVIVSGAVIRFTEEGPRWHTNTAHHAIGLIDTSVEPFINASGWLEFPLVENGQPNPHPVVSMTIASDEGLTAVGIFCGASSGTTEVRVRCSKAGVNGADTAPLNLNNEVHWDRMSCPNCNAWVLLTHQRMPESP